MENMGSEKIMGLGAVKFSEKLGTSIVSGIVFSICAYHTALHIPDDVQLCHIQ